MQNLLYFCFSCLYSFCLNVKYKCKSNKYNTTNKICDKFINAEIQKPKILIIITKLRSKVQPKISLKYIEAAQIEAIIKVAKCKLKDKSKNILETLSFKNHHLVSASQKEWYNFFSKIKSFRELCQRGDSQNAERSKKQFQ